MSKRAKKFSGYISAGVLICFFVLINLTFGNHILANEKTEQSGKEYTEREEFIFSDIFQSEEDYIEQKFIPQREGLDQIKIRLAINYAGLPDEMVVKIDLCQEDRVIQSEEIDKEQIRNWHYYDYNIKEKLAPGEEYTVRISQPIGPEDEKDGKYWVSYGGKQGGVFDDDKDGHQEITDGHKGHQDVQYFHRSIFAKNDKCGDRH